MKKETKAARVERIKQEKDGLDVLKDIEHYAQSHAPIDPEDIDRFKWYGLYTQNRSLQDDDDTIEYFMLRVKLEKGELTSKQLKTVGSISRRYARNTADFTTRQDLQFHWIQVRNLPAIFAQLHAVGLSTQLAAGDCVRNIICCPVNGIDADQTADVTDIVTQLNREFQNNRTFSNLPRKFKIAVCGCNKHCISHEIQDLSFTAHTLSDGSTLLSVTVGGGLGSNRRIAEHIGYVHAHQALNVAKAVTELFRDHGNRSNRSKARLGHLIEAWGIATFVTELENKLGFRLLQHDAPQFTPYAQRSHFGIHPSTVAKESFIGCALNSGNIGGEALTKLSKILHVNSADAIRVTPTQNFVVIGVPDERTLTLASDLEDMGFSAFPSVFKARTLACTGLNFCKFAVSETKVLAQRIVDHLQKEFPQFSEPLSISVNGCPNACAHPYVVDIGLLGCIVKENNQRVSGFELIFYGHLEGDKSHFGIKSGIKVTPQSAPYVIADLIREYQRHGSYTFKHFLQKKVS
ncbi:MAG: nitrite/sulfite reductase [Sulfurimonas sp.]|nr:MAG: nitrite/sulfite reductase [Sulfurimonas sp.]